MIRISVVSSDELFAAMLCSEIEDLGNEYKLVSKNAKILILDLDSDCDMLDDQIVVGFSRNEKALTDNVRDKCRVVLHRPFLIEDLKTIIKELGAQEKENSFSERKTATGSLLLDNSTSSVELYGKKIHLSRNEYAILDRLAESLGSPVSREDLSKVLSSSLGNMCDVYICHLRAKLESVSEKKLIFTVRGKGYMLKI